MAVGLEAVGLEAVGLEAVGLEAVGLEAVGPDEHNCVHPLPQVVAGLCEAGLRNPRSTRCVV